MEENIKLKLKGTAIIESRKLDGTLIKREVINNLVVNVGLERVAKLIGGDESDYFDYMAIGEGESADAVAAGDTALKSEVRREQADNSGSRYEADYKIVFEHTFDFYSAETFDITEVGVFDADTAGVMLDRLICSSFTVDADTSLYVKVTLTVDVV